MGIRYLYRWLRSGQLAYGVGVNGQFYKLPTTGIAMAGKSLGMIHTCNAQTAVVSSGDLLDVDLPGILSTQLQRTIRQGNSFKVVGIDLSLNTQGTIGGGQVSGFIRYYAPTQGRCQAYRDGFKAMKKQLDIQGISTRDNPLYDFRIALNDASGPLANNATLDGVNRLQYYNVAEPRSGVFDVHNQTVPVQYTGSAGNLFDPGFDTLLSSGATSTDFVLNDTVLYSGNPEVAAVGWEFIPFQLSWTPDSTDMSVTLEWRPDPALYLSVLGGMLQIYIEEINLDGGAPALELEAAVMVSGWKSVMSPLNRRKSMK